MHGQLARVSIHTWLDGAHASGAHAWLDGSHLSSHAWLEGGTHQCEPNSSHAWPARARLHPYMAGRRLCISVRPPLAMHA